MEISTLMPPPKTLLLATSAIVVTSSTDQRQERVSVMEHGREWIQFVNVSDETGMGMEKGSWNWNWTVLARPPVLLT